MPSDLRFSASPSDAVRGRSHVVLMGPRGILRKRQPWKHLFKGRWTSALEEMAAGTEPAPLGRLVTTWPSTERVPARVSLGILPDTVSRHLSPSRAHAVQECCSKAELSRGGATAVVLVLDDERHLLPAAVAVGRALPTFDLKTGKRRATQVTVAAMLADGTPIAPPQSVVRTVAAARWAAGMVDRPTADLDTAMFVEQALAFLDGVGGVDTQVIVGDDLLGRSLGAIHAVGRAATVPPRLLVLAHGPESSRRTVALVGKGVVFDSGGLALKPREGMLGMKGDMGGGAAAVGAFRTLVAEGFPGRLLCVVPLAENAVGPMSYRQDEVLRMHSGKTVEINNTDAEGRLLLADAASFAVRELGAGVVVEAATLTGAQPVSTGKRHAAVISNLEGLERLGIEAGLRSGDLCRPLPFAPELYQREFKSEIADMKNSVRDRANAQSSCAAQFVWSHIAETGVPWLHLDIAGPAHHAEKGTGFGVALMAEIVRSLGEEHLR